MTREEYIEELRARISHLPKEERESALSYYIEYLEDATDKTMEEIVAADYWPVPTYDDILFYV